MFDDVKDQNKDEGGVAKPEAAQDNNEKQHEKKDAFSEPSNEPVKEDINQRIERLSKEGGSKKGSKGIVISVILLIILAGIAGASFMYWEKISSLLGAGGEGEIACQMDAKECPDGSFVGRVAPDCEFAECTAPVKACVEEGGFIYGEASKEEREKECCAGLMALPDSINIKGECAPVADVAICINCGNGECEEGENECKCPEDCDEKNENAMKYLDKESCGTETNDQCFYIDCNNPSITMTDALFPLICEEPYDMNGVWLGQAQVTEICHNWCDEKYGEPLPNNPGTGISAGDDCMVGCAIPQEAFQSNKDKVDSDNDGLYDDEESEYGTDMNNPDSDGDGYLDGEEVKGGYNPAGDGKLIN